MTKTKKKRVLKSPMFLSVSNDRWHDPMIYFSEKELSEAAISLTNYTLYDLRGLKPVKFKVELVDE